VSRGPLFAVCVLAVATATGCERPYFGRDGTVTFPQGGARGAAVLTANGVEYRDREDVPQRLVVRDPNEPWRAPIGFILPKDGRFTVASVPHVLATTGLAIVLRPSDTRVPSWGGEVLVRVDVIAPAAEGTARWGENVAIVIDGDGPDAVLLADTALAQLAGRDRVTIIDAHGARTIVPLMPASNRSMVIAALSTHLKRRARPARELARAVRDAAAAIATTGSNSDVTQRVLVLGEAAVNDGADQAGIAEIAKLAERGVQVAQVPTRGDDDSRSERIEAVRQAIPQAGMTTFRDVKLTFQGTPAPSHVLETSGGDARWMLDGGVLALGNVRAGEARTEVLRVSVPAWVPGESFRFTVTAHVDDLQWGGPRDFSADVPCVYDDDIESIAKSRHGDVIAYSSALATLRRLDKAFVGDEIDRAGGLRRIAEMHAKSMQLLARDTKDFATQEQADMLAALLKTTSGR
jgi:hypothetical protein